MKRVLTLIFVACFMGLNATAQSSAGSGKTMNETFPVTFIVDMTSAVAAGDVEFDPQVHNVYIAGEFPNWVKPGEDPAFKMTPFETRNTEPELLIDELFGASFPPAGWEVVSQSNTTWGSVTSVVIPGTTPTTINPKEGTHFALCRWTAAAGQQQNEKLITPALNLTNATEATLKFWFFGSYHWSVVNPNCDLNVWISVAGSNWEQIWNEADHPQYISTQINYQWLETTLDLGAFIGNDNVRLMFQYLGHDGANFGLDAVRLFAVIEDDNTDPDPDDPTLFAITLDLESGTYQYKFFIIEGVTPGWDMGEWEGGENRSIVVTGATTKEHLFGVPDEPDDPSGSGNPFDQNHLVVFPNPANTFINIKSEQIIREVQIFDTSARLVRSQVVGDFSATINVSDLNRGMYFLHIIGQSQIKTQKIQLIR
jgi:hypothetical protein